MTQYAMIVLIVALVMTASAFKHWAKLKHAQMQRGNDADTKATNDRIADLEERVRVLERIATDKGARLSEEIDAL